LNKALAASPNGASRRPSVGRIRRSLLMS
jgi:hypothetical protein